MTLDNWPRSRIEQELFLTELETEIARLETTRQSILIHNFSIPTQSDWEIAYLEQSGGALPIPPGTILCWINLMTAHVVSFGTAFDRDNGLTSSGKVYPYGQIQNKSHFRFIGNLTYQGYFANAETDQQFVHIGTNLSAWQKRRLLMIECYFRIREEDDDFSDLVFDFGGLIVHADFSDGATDVVSILEGDEGVATQTLDQTFKSDYVIESLEQTPGAQFEFTTGFFRIFDPFGAHNAGGDFEAQKSALRMGGYFWHSTQIAPGARFQSFTLSQLYRGHMYENSQFGILPGGASIGANRARGWIYGWFAEAQDILEEFPDGI